MLHVTSSFARRTFLFGLRDSRECNFNSALKHPPPSESYRGNGENLLATFLSVSVRVRVVVLVLVVISAAQKSEGITILVLANGDSSPRRVNMYLLLWISVVFSCRLLL